MRTTTWTCPGAKQNRSHETAPISAGQLGPSYDSLQPVHQAGQAFGRVNWTISEARPIITRGKGWLWTVIKVMGRYWLDLPQRYRSPKDRRLTAGNALLAQLRLGLNARNVPVQLGVSCKELIVEQGRVVGAVVERSGERRTVRVRRGLVLGAGGFERNTEMRNANFQTASSADWSGSQRNNTGDAIQAAQRAGAALDLMDAAWWAPAFRLSDEERARPMFVERALPGCMIVNQLGRRYMNESASYHVAGGEMMRLNSPECPTAPSWFIFDAEYRGKYALGPMLPGPPSMDRGFKASFKEVLRKGATVVELAAAMEVAPDVLQDTFARFNEYADKGEDPDFQRGVNGLRPLLRRPAQQPQSLPQGVAQGALLRPEDLPWGHRHQGRRRHRRARPRPGRRRPAHRRPVRHRQHQRLSDGPLLPRRRLHPRTGHDLRLSGRASCGADGAGVLMPSVCPARQCSIQTSPLVYCIVGLRG